MATLVDVTQIGVSAIFVMSPKVAKASKATVRVTRVFAEKMSCGNTYKVKPFLRCNDTQHNDTQDSDTQHNDDQHNVI
jgi:hypothetical protein